MTKDEFIDGYILRSGLIGQKVRTEYGFILSGAKHIAKPCDCGDEMCDGWQMAYEDRVEAEEDGA